MEKRGWPVRKSSLLIDSTFPTSFVISGAVDWFNYKIANDPFGSEGYATCQRCFRHWDSPDKTHLPFFWMLLNVSWNLHSWEKVMQDNFDFLTQILKVDASKLEVTYWEGGKVFGSNIKTEADVDGFCKGSEFQSLKEDGIFIEKDEEAIAIWKRLGIKDEQLIYAGEKSDSFGRDAVLLNAREHFAGIRSEPYYKFKNGSSFEIGVFLHESHIKKPFALKLNIPDSVLIDSKNEDKFLLRIKPQVKPGGFGLERIAMAANNLESVFELEPYSTMKAFLKQTMDADGDYYRESLAEKITALIPAIVFTIHDGALLLNRSQNQRRSIYRGALKAVIDDLRILDLDVDEIYSKLFEITTSFYLQDEEFFGLKGIETTCLDEIKRQKERIIEDLQTNHKPEKNGKINRA